MSTINTTKTAPITLAGLSPAQKAWMTQAMAGVGLLFLWKAAQGTWPSITLAALGVTVYAAATVAFCQFTNSLPRFRPVLPWCAVAFAGGFLNFAVFLANGGYMPAVGLTEPRGLHAPMEGARLAILADWIIGGISPGDVLLIACGVAIVVVLVRQWRAK